MILLIDNYDSFTYNLYQYVAQLHSEIRVVRNNKITVPEIMNLNPEGIILSPGPGRPEDAGVCVDLVNYLLANPRNNPIPLLGVCLGHQVIAVSAGADVVLASEICHGKEDLIFHQRKGLYQNLELPFRAARYHSLIIDRNTLPKTLLIEAENSQGIIMGIKHTELPIYGVQFHPESILTPSGDKLLYKFMQECVSLNKSHRGAA